MKRLYFYLWVSPDFEENAAVRVHEICLKRYIHLFDDVNFVVATDKYPYTDDLKRAISWINGICGEIPYRVRHVDNITIRESRMVFEDILPIIEQKSKDLVFIAHSKAITDVGMSGRNKYSVLRWVISMYYYNLEDKYIKEMESIFEKGDREMYGSLLTYFPNFPNETITSHNCIYIGNFYWIYPWAIKTISDFEIPKVYDRFLSENLPLYMNFARLSGPNNIVTNCNVADLYHLSKEWWPQYLSYYGDADILYERQNEVIMESCGEEGY